MKRVSVLFLCLLLLAGCARDGRGSAIAQFPEADTLARAALEAAGEDPDALERTDQALEPDGLATYIAHYYGVTSEAWEACALYRAGGASAVEVAVLRLSPGADGAAALEGLNGYIADREGDFTGYAPDQAQLVSQARAVQVAAQVGEEEIGFAGLFICADPAAAREAFLDYFQGQPVREDRASSPAPSPSASGQAVRYPGRTDYVQPGKDDMSIYDTAAIRAAWAAEDPDGLSAYDRTIYDLCREVLAQTLREGMDGLEMERALYRWLTVHVDYDYDHYNPLVVMDPDSYTPYGPLVNGKGVCLGYASTFQLFMDLCGVECITVVGAAFHSREDHAWNMVRLDGQWYCVDPTWDEGRPEEFWNYFNVDSDFMAATDHQWDYATVPETGGEGT